MVGTKTAPTTMGSKAYPDYSPASLHQAALGLGLTQILRHGKHGAWFLDDLHRVQYGKPPKGFTPPTITSTDGKKVTPSEDTHGFAKTFADAAHRTGVQLPLQPLVEMVEGANKAADEATDDHWSAVKAHRRAPNDYSFPQQLFANPFVAALVAGEPHLQGPDLRALMGGAADDWRSGSTRSLPDGSESPIDLPLHAIAAHWLTDSEKKDGLRTSDILMGPDRGFHAAMQAYRTASHDAAHGKADATDLANAVQAVKTAGKHHTDRLHATHAQTMAEERALSRVARTERAKLHGDRLQQREDKKLPPIGDSELDDLEKVLAHGMEHPNALTDLALLGGTRRGRKAMLTHLTQTAVRLRAMPQAERPPAEVILARALMRGMRRQEDQQISEAQGRAGEKEWPVVAHALILAGRHKLAKELLETHGTGDSILDALGIDARRIAGHLTTLPDPKTMQKQLEEEGRVPHRLATKKEQGSDDRLVGGVPVIPTVAKGFGGFFQGGRNAAAAPASAVPKVGVPKVGAGMVLPRTAADPVAFRPSRELMADHYTRTNDYATNPARAYGAEAQTEAQAFAGRRLWNDESFANTRNGYLDYTRNMGVADPLAKEYFANHFATLHPHDTYPEDAPGLHLHHHIGYALGNAMHAIAARRYDDDPAMMGEKGLAIFRRVMGAGTPDSLAARAALSQVQRQRERAVAENTARATHEGLTQLAMTNPGLPLHNPLDATRTYLNHDPQLDPYDQSVRDDAYRTVAKRNARPTIMPSMLTGDAREQRINQLYNDHTAPWRAYGVRSIPDRNTFVRNTQMVLTDPGRFKEIAPDDQGFRQYVDIKNMRAGPIKTWFTSPAKGTPRTYTRGGVPAAPSGRRQYRSGGNAAPRPAAQWGVGDYLDNTPGATAADLRGRFPTKYPNAAAAAADLANYHAWKGNAAPPSAPPPSAPPPAAPAPAPAPANEDEGEGEEQLASPTNQHHLADAPPPPGTPPTPVNASPVTTTAPPARRRRAKKEQAAEVAAPPNDTPPDAAPPDAAPPKRRSRRAAPAAASAEPQEQEQEQEQEPEPPAAPPEGPVPAAAWQQTRAQYWAKQGGTPPADPHADPHLIGILNALRRGQAVPPRILAEYGDLIPRRTSRVVRKAGVRTLPRMFAI